MPTQRKSTAIVSKLLEWFFKNARDLPWRSTRDAYAVWVSEIMLQQTQVKTVIPYWERWMRELPDVAALAAARPEKLHKLWEGLGYYTRVRNLHRAAQEIVARHDGKFPRRFEDILELPGIGRYTAGAIASIAFNEPRAILDGNVVRVLTRVFGILENTKAKETTARLWELAGLFVTEASTVRWRGHGRHHLSGACSALNQSLMELGATVCTPRQPKCMVCPLRTLCVARRIGHVDSLPNLGPRVASTARRFAAFVFERRGKFLVRQRLAGVVNAQLWEFPNVEVGASGFDAGRIAAKEFGVATKGIARLGIIKHSITRYRITMEVFRAAVGAGNGTKRAAGRWVSREVLEALPFASAHRRVVERLIGKSRSDNGN